MSILDMRTIHDAAASRRTAADIMRPDPRTCSPFSTVLEATVIFRDEDCDAVPVVDEGRPVGIVTDRDVALALPDYTDLADRPVSDIMSRGVVSVRPDDPLDVVRHKFGDQKVRHVLVLDADDQLVGIIAWDDLIPHLPAEDVCEVVAEIVERSPSGSERKERDDGDRARAQLVGPGVAGPLRRALRDHGLRLAGDHPGGAGAPLRRLCPGGRRLRHRRGRGRQDRGACPGGPCWWRAWPASPWGS